MNWRTLVPARDIPAGTYDKHSWQWHHFLLPRHQLQAQAGANVGVLSGNANGKDGGGNANANSASPFA